MSAIRRPRRSVEKALDARLDQALEATFPASDPVAITIEPISFEPEQSRGATSRPARRERSIVE